jgi:hypothetical protein
MIYHFGLYKNDNPNADLLTEVLADCSQNARQVALQGLDAVPAFAYPDFTPGEYRGRLIASHIRNLGPVRSTEIAARVEKRMDKMNGF